MYGCVYVRVCLCVSECIGLSICDFVIRVKSYSIRTPDKNGYPTSRFCAIWRA